MKYVAAAALSVSALVLASPALAAFDCGTDITPLFGGTAYSVIFDSFDGFTATPTTPAVCDVNVSLVNPLAPGVVAVYSADYSAALDIYSTGRLLVLNEGRTAGVIVANGDTDSTGRVLFDFVGTNATGDGIDSQIWLDLLEYFDGDSTFVLDSIDYVEIAQANISDLQISADSLATTRLGTVTHLNGTLDLLDGAGRPFDEEDGFNAVGGIGSITLGVQGRAAVTPDVSVRGGLAFIDQQVGNSSTTGVVGSAAVRYAPQSDEMPRPFADFGVRAAPGLAMSFSRSYVTNVGTMTGVGQTTGTFLGAFITGGVLVAPDPSNEIVFSASLSRDALTTAAYSETMSASNPFAASAPAQTGIFDTVKASAEWTTTPTEGVDLTLSGAVGVTGSSTPVATQIAFAGNYTSPGASEVFVEYGARAGFELAPEMNAGLFVFGTTGASSGTHVQVGGDLRVRF